jgi:mRNA interferase RelE/StbE
MHYQVLLPSPVQKQLRQLPPEAQGRILSKIQALQDDPRPAGCVKLRGFEAEYRIRIGDYRVRYEITDLDRTVVILHCAHRKDIYR